MLLENKVAIVTGAGRGIGRGIALKLAAEGCIPVVNDIEEESATAVCSEIIGLGKEAFAFAGDVSDENDVQAMVKATIDKFGKIDILVNNAGISTKREGRRPTITEISLEEWNRVIAVNLTSVFLCCKAVIPYLIRQKSGRIINISSVAALTGGVLSGPNYAASKGGVRTLTRNLAADLAPHGITINNIAPGRIQTPMTELSSDEVNRDLLQRIPMGRFGTPEELADAVIFLASENSQYITGTTLNVSGGFVTS